MVSFLHFVERTSERLVRAMSIKHHGLQNLFRRESITPAICYDDCNNAYVVAQSYGKTKKICEPDSAFQVALVPCKSCIKENAVDTEPTRDYVEPLFEQYIDYCEENNTTTEVLSTTVTSVGTKKTETSVLITTVAAATPTSDPGCESCIVTTIKDVNGKVYEITMGPHSITGSLSFVNTPTTTPTSSAKSTNDSSSSPNLAVIVGPIVPSVVLLLLLGFLALRWYKRRRAIKVQQGSVPDEEKPKLDKPQLHSDCVTQPTFELEGSGLAVTPGTRDKQEMAANEPAAHEISADKSIDRNKVQDATNSS